MALLMLSAAKQLKRYICLCNNMLLPVMQRLHTGCHHPAPLPALLVDRGCHTTVLQEHATCSRSNASVLELLLQSLQLDDTAALQMLVLRAIALAATP